MKVTGRSLASYQESRLGPYMGIYYFIFLLNCVQNTIASSPAKHVLY